MDAEQKRKMLEDGADALYDDIIRNHKERGEEGMLQAVAAGVKIAMSLGSVPTVGEVIVKTFATATVRALTDLGYVHEPAPVD